MMTVLTVSLLTVLLLVSKPYCFAQNVPYRSLLVSQASATSGNIVQGKFVNSSSSISWIWRNFTGELGIAIAGITVSNNDESLEIGMMNKSGVVSSDGRSFSILATGLNYCHYVVILPVGYLMLYTDAHEHIYQVNLKTKDQTILLDNVGGSAGTRGLVYDSRNNWIYFSGVQLMRSNPDGTGLQNITKYLNLTDANPGFQIVLDSHVDPRNPRVYLAFDGGLYMVNADGNNEQLIFSFPIEDDFTGPYGVAIGVDPFDDKRYIYWCRGRRNKVAYLERSVMTDDGRLTTIESIWNDTNNGNSTMALRFGISAMGFPLVTNE